MFVGEFRETLDVARRFRVPAPFRVPLQSPEDLKGLWALAAGPPLELCIRLYPAAAWRSLATMAGPAAMARWSVAFAEFGSDGLLWLPEGPAKRARLRRDVVVVGMCDWIEVWDVAEYETATRAIEEDVARKIRLW